MKLCIVTHKVAKGDGQGRVNYEVAQEALRRGYHLTLVSSFVAPELEGDSHVHWVPIQVKGLPIDLLQELSFAHRTAQYLQQNRNQFDVVKVNGAITWATGDVNAAHFVHGAWLNSPVHTFRQRQDLYGLYQWIYTALNAHWENRAFRQAKQVIAVSNQVKHDLQTSGILSSQIQVILNGVDTEEFVPGEVNRSSLGLPDDVTIAIFAGDIRTPRKNLDSVLRALVVVPDLHLIVVGDLKGSPYPDLAQHLAVSERVHFLGYRSDISDLMRASDFLVFPSRYETFGLVVLEAMASGIPVITTVTTPAYEIVTSDCGIVLRNANDISMLAEAMNTLTKNALLRQHMGRFARKVAEQHSWKKMAQEYVDLFEKLN